jgi:hypothetical protein
METYGNFLKSWIFHLESRGLWRNMKYFCHCFGSEFIESGSGSSILGWIPIRIRIQDFDDQKLKKIYNWKKIRYFFDQKLQFLIPRPTGEAIRPQKRTSSTSKQEISKLFLFLWVIFSLLDSDPDSEYQLTWLNPDSIRIKIYLNF